MKIELNKNNNDMFNIINRIKSIKNIIIIILNRKKNYFLKFDLF